MGAIVLKIPGYVPPKGSGAVTNMMTVSSGYFRTYGIPLLEGRDFTSEDRGKDNVAVIVNQQFAKQFFGGDALGKTLAYGGGINARVVGIAANTKYRFLKESQQPLMYLAVTQRGFPQSLYLQVRTSSEAPAMIERLRGMVRDMDPRMPAGEVTTMAMQLDRVLSRERLLAFLSTLLGGLALTLAAIGLYGVLSFSVARRTREIGIRMAIGAPRASVLGMFLRESAWIVAAGAALGIPLALGCGKLASTLLYGVEGQDPRIAAGATVLLALVAVAAALIPAARAARVDPLRALRHE
jgi:predicted permease